MAILYTAICVWRPRYGFSRKYSTPTASATDEDEATQLPPLSVIIVSADEGACLEDALRKIFSQDYPNFEVIAVDAASDDSTADTITRLQGEYTNLRRSHIPHSAQQIQRINLSLMLGVRAARNEWVLLTRATGAPSSNSWLRLMMSTALGTNSKAVEGFTNYETDFDPGNLEQQTIRHYHRQEAERLTGLYLGKTCQTPATNLLIHRSEAIDMIETQHHCTLGGKLETSLCLAPEAWIKCNTTYFNPKTIQKGEVKARHTELWSKMPERWSSIFIYIMVSLYGIARVVQYSCTEIPPQTGTSIDEIIVQAQNLCNNYPGIWCNEPILWICDGIIITILVTKLALSWHSRHLAMQTIGSI